MVTTSPMILYLTALLSVSFAMKKATPTTSSSNAALYDSDLANKSVVCGKSMAECSIDCSSAGGCAFTHIECSSAECKVSCSSGACLSTTMVFTSTASRVSVNCTGYDACHEVTITGTGDSGSQSEFNLTTVILTDLKAPLTDSSITLSGYHAARIVNGDGDEIRSMTCAESCNANTYRLDNIQVVDVVQKFRETTFRPQSFQISNPKSVHMSCIGSLSCHGDEMNVTGDGARVLVECAKSGACQNFDVIVSELDYLNMKCLSSSEDEVEVCLGAELFVSSLSNHTHLWCTNGRSSCSEMEVIVPPQPDTDFLTIHFVNEDGSASTSGAGNTLDDFEIFCNGNSELCTEWTPYPLLGHAEPSYTNDESKQVFYTAKYSYHYMFKQITCESGQECFIDCNTWHGCANLFVDCQEGSTCHIECAYAYQCHELFVKAHGNEVNLNCQSESACDMAGVWLSEDDDRLDLSTTMHDALKDLVFLCGNISEYGTFQESNSTTSGLACENEGCCPVWALPGRPDGGASETSSSGSSAMTVAIVVGGIVVLITCVVAVFALRWLNQKQQDESHYVSMQP